MTGVLITYGLIGVIVMAIRYWLLNHHATTDEVLFQKVDAINSGLSPWMHDHGKVPLSLRIATSVVDAITNILGVIAWPVVLYRMVERQRFLRHQLSEESQRERERTAKLAAEKRRIQRMSVEEIESRESFPDGGDVPALPFGFLNSAWLSFKSQIQAGDEIWLFEIQPSGTWKYGAEGYVLLRSGIEVARQLSHAG